MLLEAFVAVLVVDFAGFADGEGVVGFGDFDEFLRGRVIATRIGRIESEAPLTCSHLLKGACLSVDLPRDTHGFLSGWNFLLRVRYAFLISRSDADLSMLRSL